MTAIALLLACLPASPTNPSTGRPAASFAPASTVEAPTPTIEAPASAEIPDIRPAELTQEALVVRVTDGDTITVEINGVRHDVRYIGIDSPEKSGPYTRPEALGAEATRANERLVGGQVVHLERDRTDSDRFDRLLRYVWLDTPDGWLMANRELVRMGLAESKTYEPDTAWQWLLDDAEGRARDEHLGMWAALPPPTPVRFVGTGCDPAYPDGCIAPPPPDLDCRDIAFRRFTVLPPDPHNFDGDLNGIGCEAP